MTIVLGLSGSLLAGSVTTQVTNNSYEDSFPRIKADHIVWQGRNDGDWEIFLYNIATGVTTQITDNDYDDLSPQTDGSYIVWQGFKDHEWDIFLWNGSEVQAISDRSAQDASPQIANGRIVWTSEPFGEEFVGPSEVVLYDVETQTRPVLSADVDPGNTLDDGGPRINDEVVIWIQTDDQDNTTLYMYDLSNGSITESPEYVWRDSSQRDGIVSVLSRHDGHDRELFVYSSNSRRYYQVTNNSLDDRYPSISANHVAWMAAGEIFVAEYEYLGLMSPMDNARLPNGTTPTFAWEGIGYDGFKIEFSGSPSFPTLEASVFPSGEGTWTSQTSFTPTEEQWKAIREIQEGNGTVYWRVEAKDAEGGVSFSEVRNFTIDEPGAIIRAAVEPDAKDTTVGTSCFIETVLSWN